jgi:D-glycero-alpha-D-manno-heptose-7-phosphate kinase
MAKMVITRTPLRISFFGGGTDFPGFYRSHGGIILSAAIDKFVDVVVRERFFNDIVISTSEKETHLCLDEVKHNLIREAMKLVTPHWSSVEIATLADVPGAGTGLGSSAAVTMGVLFALGLFKGRIFAIDELAEKAFYIESEILKYATGVQDHYITAYGGTRYMTLGESVYISPKLTCWGLKEHLALLYTGRVRNGRAILEPFAREIESKVEQLKITSTLAEAGITAFLKRDWEWFGRLLDDSWQVKKSWSQASTPEIDLLCDKAKAAGAWGCKILGAGQGGFLLVCAPKEKIPEFGKELGLRQLSFNFYDDGVKQIL